MGLASNAHQVWEATMTHDSKAIALAYLDAVGTKQLDRLDTLVSPEVRFVGPAMTMTGRALERPRACRKLAVCSARV
jgi:hypothetical protein